MEQADASWTIAGIGDLGGDGRDDLLWRHTGGALYVWEMSGAAAGRSSFLPAISLQWGIEGLGDLDGDG